MARSKRVSRIRAGGEAPLSEVGESEDQRLQRLAAKGVILLGSGSLPDGIWELERPVDPEGAAVEGLIEDRKSSS